MRPASTFFNIQLSNSRDEAQVKIAENLEVNSEFYDFEKEIEIKAV